MDAEVLQEDILTENGVIHLIDDLILPFGDLDMSIEATLMALNATRFVNLIYEAGLQSYINKPAHKQRQEGEAFTFLAPRDDVIDTWYRGIRSQSPSPLPAHGCCVSAVKAFSRRNRPLPHSTWSDPTR